MKRAANLIFLVTGICFFAGCASAPYLAIPLPKKAIPPTVAVSSFDNLSGFKDSEWSIGEGMADLLVSELVASCNFDVVERENLEVLMEEIERQKGDSFRAEGKVNLGRLKNVRYMIRGVINDFCQVSGGGISLAIKKILFLGRGHTARVSMTLTIVDVETGKIISSIHCSGKASARTKYLEAEYKGISFGGETFFKTPLGIATSNAMRKGVRGITQKMPRIYWEPMVADVNNDGHIVINGGKDRGIRQGQEYNVRGEGRPVTDPVTGDLLAIVPGPILGMLRVFEVHESISYAQIISGSGFQRGQRLRRK